MKVNAIIDTGSSVNVIDKATYKKIGSPRLSNSPSVLYSFGANKKLDIEGQFEAIVKARGKGVQCIILVMEGPKVCNILSENLALELGLVQYIKKIDTCVEEQFPQLFDGFGKLTNYQVKIHVNKEVQPVVQTSRKVPFALRDRVDMKLTELVDLDIIEQVSDTPTSWVSPMVVIPKKGDDVRICIDMRRVNQAVIRERFPIPTIDEVMLEMNGSSVFSKLDLRMGYHQIELDGESRKLTTFNTHRGLFRYKRLMFGISAAPEIYQNVI